MGACNADGACVGISEVMCGPEDSIDVDICMGGVMMPSDFFQLGDISLEGDTLTVEVSYSGGCTDHTFSSCAYGSLPPGGTQDEMGFVLTLHHMANGDNCEAWITQEVAINLEPLKEEWMAISGSESGVLPILVEGTDMPFFYEF